MPGPTNLVRILVMSALFADVVAGVKEDDATAHEGHHGKAHFHHENGETKGRISHSEKGHRKHAKNKRLIRPTSAPTASAVQVAQLPTDTLLGVVDDSVVGGVEDDELKDFLATDFDVDPQTAKAQPAKKARTPSRAPTPKMFAELQRLSEDQLETKDLDDDANGLSSVSSPARASAANAADGMGPTGARALLVKTDGEIPHTKSFKSSSSPQRQEKIQRTAAAEAAASAADAHAQRKGAKGHGSAKAVRSPSAPILGAAGGLAPVLPRARPSSLAPKSKGSSRLPQVFAETVGDAAAGDQEAAATAATSAMEGIRLAAGGVRPQARARRDRGDVVVQVPADEGVLDDVLGIGYAAGLGGEAAEDDMLGVAEAEADAAREPEDAQEEVHGTALAKFASEMNEQADKVVDEASRASHEFRDVIPDRLRHSHPSKTEHGVVIKSDVAEDGAKLATLKQAVTNEKADAAAEKSVKFEAEPPDESTHQHKSGEGDGTAGGGVEDGAKRTILSKVVNDNQKRADKNGREDSKADGRIGVGDAEANDGRDSGEDVQSAVTQQIQNAVASRTSELRRMIHQAIRDTEARWADSPQKDQDAAVRLALSKVVSDIHERAAEFANTFTQEALAQAPTRVSPDVERMLINRAEDSIRGILDDTLRAYAAVQEKHAVRGDDAQQGAANQTEVEKDSYGSVSAAWNGNQEMDSDVEASLTNKSFGTSAHSLGGADAADTGKGDEEADVTVTAVSDDGEAQAAQATRTGGLRAKVKASTAAQRAANAAAEELDAAEKAYQAKLQASAADKKASEAGQLAAEKAQAASDAVLQEASPETPLGTTDDIVTAAQAAKAAADLAYNATVAAEEAKAKARQALKDAAGAAAKAQVAADNAVTAQVGEEAYDPTPEAQGEEGDENGVSGASKEVAADNNQTAGEGPLISEVSEKFVAGEQLRDALAGDVAGEAADVAAEAAEAAEAAGEAAEAAAGEPPDVLADAPDVAPADEGDAAAPLADEADEGALWRRREPRRLGGQNPDYIAVARLRVDPDQGGLMQPTDLAALPKQVAGELPAGADSTLPPPPQPARPGSHRSQYFDKEASTIRPRPPQDEVPETGSVTPEGLPRHKHQGHRPREPLLRRERRLFLDSTPSAPEGASLLEMGGRRRNLAAGTANASSLAPDGPDAGGVDGGARDDQVQESASLVDEEADPSAANDTSALIQDDEVDKTILPKEKQTILPKEKPMDNMVDEALEGRLLTKRPTQPKQAVSKETTTREASKAKKLREDVASARVAGMPQIGASPAAAAKNQSLTKKQEPIAEKKVEETMQEKEKQEEEEKVEKEEEKEEKEEEKEEQEEQEELEKDAEEAKATQEEEAVVTPSDEASDEVAASSGAAEDAPGSDDANNTPTVSAAETPEDATAPDKASASELGSLWVFAAVGLAHTAHSLWMA